MKLPPMEEWSEVNNPGRYSRMTDGTAEETLEEEIWRNHVDAYPSEPPNSWTQTPPVSVLAMEKEPRGVAGLGATTSPSWRRHKRVAS